MESVAAYRYAKWTIALGWPFLALGTLLALVSAVYYAVVGSADVGPAFLAFGVLLLWSVLLAFLWWRMRTEDLWDDAHPIERWLAVLLSPAIIGTLLHAIIIFVLFARNEAAKQDAVWRERNRRWQAADPEGYRRMGEAIYWTQQRDAGGGDGK